MAVRQGVSPDYFIKACMHDFCHLNGENPDDEEIVVCAYLSAYSMEAARYGIATTGWRRPGLCERQCPSGQVFTECRSKCPATCGVKDRVQDADCFADCTPGCECAAGHFLHNRECVPVADCPCTHNKQDYATGETIPLKCNECTCNQGNWECTKKACMGTCSIVGHSQMTTFDGKTYSYRGQCEYSLVEGMEGLEEEVELGIFLKKHDCSGTQCLQRLRIVSGDTEITLHSGSPDVTVNGLTVAGQSYRNDDVAILRNNAFFTFVIMPGSFVMFNHDSLIYISLAPSYAHKVRGLCGTFDFNRQNDFLSGNGLEDNSIDTFTESYRTYRDQCEEEARSPGTHCSRNRAVAEVASSVCSAIAKRSGPYAACHSVISQVELAAVEASCVENACESNSIDGACVVLQDLAHRCTAAGANCTWHLQTDIQQQCSSVFSQCTEGRVYTECSDPCGATCGSLVHHDSGVCNYPSNTCVPGCDCPDGTIYDEHSHLCVQQQQCSCFDAFRQEPVPAGGSIKRACNTCHCLYGRLKCTTHQCDENICPGNQQLIKDLSPCRKTCFNYDRVPSDSECPGERYEGCGCPSGQVLDGDYCVMPEDCPCVHSGQEYASGSVMRKDCNTCTCEGKYWNCTHEQCEAYCLVTGDPHYTTWDDTSYSFEGKCAYILANDKGGKFEIHAHNEPCGSTGTTCTKSVTFHLHEPTAITYSMLRGRDFHRTVDGQEQAVPVPFSDTKVGVEVYKVGLWLIISTDWGLRLMWDGATRVQLIARPELKFQLGGLCGTYDGHQGNDMTKADGVESDDPYVFASSWKVDPNCQDIGDSGDAPVDACIVNKHRHAWAERACRVISHSPMFERCRLDLGTETVNRYYQWCETDTCACDSGGDCECLCTAVAAFAEECARAGYPVRWRSQSLCPIQCENGKEYNECGSGCPNTCYSLSRQQDDFCTMECHEGCFCPDGMVEEDGLCVDPSQCSCWEDNHRYPPGSVKTDACQQCLCINGTWQCEGEPCLNDTTCAPGQFRCLDGMCIDASDRCNDHLDCLDGSDEQGCNVTCSAHEWQCEDGACIPHDYRCDGETDCLDASDEADCPPSMCDGAHDYECKSGLCIPYNMRCDGVLDCGIMDESDETGCGECTDIRQFRCGMANDGQCQPIEHLCDGHDDCGDMSDEQNCEGCPGYCINQFRCGDCACIDPLRKCDGVQDCDNDEADCGDCAPGQFVCNNGTCLDPSKLCDGVYDCPEREDERHPDCVYTTEASLSTTPVTCADGQVACDDGTCVEGEMCNGVYDCADYSDEGPICSDLTTPGVCPPNHFPCDLTSANPVCMPDEFRCDCEIDCYETGLDEANCTPQELAAKCPTTPGQGGPPTTSSPYDCVYSFDNSLNYNVVLHLPGLTIERVIEDSTVTYKFEDPRILARVCAHIEDMDDPISVTAYDGQGNPLGNPINVPAGDNEEECTDLSPVEGVRIVKLSASNSEAIPAANVISVSIVACAEPGPGGPTNGTTPRPPHCPGYCVNEYQCGNCFCIDPHRICDGVEDCDTDETNCGDCLPGQFVCNDGTCLDPSKLCDGVEDCAEGEDESHPDCSECSEIREFECDNGNCVDIGELCDGEDDCGDNSDEQNCPDCPGTCGDDYQCGDCTCIDPRRVCDGVEDCDNDEDNCGNCDPGDFVCNDGTCLDPSKKCDGVIDCRYGEDENHPDCECTVREFECDNGKCIDIGKRCDGKDDCGDNSDEENCPDCPNDCGDDYQCGDCTCIDPSRVCDGAQDCDDDEANCGDCNPGDYVCDDGTCLDPYKMCDGVDDCMNGEDEDHPDCTECNEIRHFQCDNGVCLNIDQHCDGTDDCGDGSDEKNCPPGCPGYCVDEFQCGNCFCIDPRRVCDGVEDCDNDEDNCGDCEPGQFVCNDGTCLDADKKCDGVNDCSRGEDENHPDCSECEIREFECDDGNCIDIGKRCDGEDDCGDNSDEENCPDCPNDCGDDYLCGDCTCIDPRRVCDGVEDCDDDEANCGDCDAGQYVCNDGTCLDPSKLCDGVEDCADGEDESHPDCSNILE